MDKTNHKICIDKEVAFYSILFEISLLNPPHCSTYLWFLFVPLPSPPGTSPLLPLHLLFVPSWQPLPLLLGPWNQPLICRSYDDVACAANAARHVSAPNVATATSAETWRNLVALVNSNRPVCCASVLAVSVFTLCILLYNVAFLCLHILINIALTFCFLTIAWSAALCCMWDLWGRQPGHWWRAHGVLQLCSDYTS